MPGHVTQANQLVEPVLADPTRNRPTGCFNDLSYRDSWQQEKPDGNYKHCIRKENRDSTYLR